MVLGQPRCVTPSSTLPPPKGHCPTPAKKGKKKKKKKAVKKADGGKCRDLGGSEIWGGFVDKLKTRITYDVALPHFFDTVENVEFCDKIKTALPNVPSLEEQRESVSWYGYPFVWNDWVGDMGFPLDACPAKT